MSSNTSTLLHNEGMFAHSRGLGKSKDRASGEQGTMPVKEKSNSYGSYMDTIKKQSRKRKRKRNQVHQLNINVPQPFSYIGSTKDTSANRAIFGKAVNLVLDGLSKEEAAKKVMVINNNMLHFGINFLFADNSLSDVKSFRYFPTDPAQMIAVVKHVFFKRGLRFIFSTQSKVPYILKEDSKTKYFGNGYEFVPGKDEVIIKGLINKPTLNSVDEELGSKFEMWLLKRGLTPKYAYLGTTKEGCSDLWKQFPYQSLNSESIATKIALLAH
ncbi:hypothetical protein ARMSODRAFT_1055124 [Armillaria solidipes]|uniref:Uncharacterized protein n=1 Tax=Armillaria solidipes TaxID=1076256 RepID=A0A2H3BUL1_9AGAR|nr:hypothetical protein ARMSODRAFT_1055124 [Armillaria solidipes]